MNATVTRQELAEIIGEQTLHEDKQQLAKSVAAYLAEAHRKVDIDSLVRDVMVYRQSKGIIEAVAVSAHELTPVVLDDIRELLKTHFPEAKSVVIDQRLDESVVGGIRIELPTEVLDLSIKSKLNLFKRLVAEERK